MGDVTALRHCGGCAQRAWEARALPEPDVFPHPVGFSPTAGTDSPPQVSTKQLLGHPRTLPEPLVSSLNPEGAYVPVGPWEPEPVRRGWVGTGERLLLPKMGCREQACAGGGRPELFIDAIRKRKAHTPAVSALLPGALTLAARLSALPGAVEDGSHPLSCHSVFPRVKISLRMGRTCLLSFTGAAFAPSY